LKGGWPESFCIRTTRASIRLENIYVAEWVAHGEDYKAEEGCVMAEE